MRRHITCKSCKYHNKLNRETAPEVAQALRAGRFDIKDNHRNAALAYMKKRYGIWLKLLDEPELEITSPTIVTRHWRIDTSREKRARSFNAPNHSRTLKWG